MDIKRSKVEKKHRQEYLPIRKAEPNDFDALQRLLSASDLPHEDLSKTHLQHFSVITQGSELLASVGLEIYGKYALLRSLSVHVNHRSKGWGKKLVSSIEAYAREKELQEIYLLTTTAESFFGSLGYTTVTRDTVPEAVQQSEEFATICPDSAVAMKKEL